MKRTALYLINPASWLLAKKAHWAFSLRLALPLTIYLFFFSCKKESRWDLFKSTGKMVLQSRTVDPFTDIQVGNNRINIFITQDNHFDVKVEAGEHLVENVTTEVRDGRLYIENRNKCNFVRSYKIPINIFIHMPLLSHIYHDGSGTITSTNTMVNDTIDIITKSAGNVSLDINCNKVLTHLHSNADITLTGFCNQHACYATGYGFVNAQDLVSDYTWIYSISTGDIHVNVNSLLIVTIKSLGDVYYTGNPGTIDQDLRGEGELIHQ